MQNTEKSNRSNAIRFSIFNHKGGVGKTTLTMNIAAALAATGKRVLLVDSDPQCNLTSYLVADEVVDDLLDNSDGAKGRTVWSAIKPVSEATGGVASIRPIESGIENLFLIPGDIRLSEFEVDLTEFWGQCLQRKTKGFRGTTALSMLVSDVSNKLEIDYIFYDSGPNIGPLNRAILLDCDYFLVPVACDLFSLRALKTLGRTLVDWISAWSTISDLAPKDTNLLPGHPKFLGYIPEGFRVWGGSIASEHSKFLSRIEKGVHNDIVALLRNIDPTLAQGRLQQYKLGEVKNFGALVPASQRHGLPLWQVNEGSPKQRNDAKKAFYSIAEKIKSRTDSGQR